MILKTVAKVVSSVSSMSTTKPVLPLLTFASQEQIKRAAFIPPQQGVINVVPKSIPKDLSRIKNESKPMVKLRVLDPPRTIDENVTIAHPIPQLDSIAPTSMASFESLMAGKFTRTYNDLDAVQTLWWMSAGIVTTLADMKALQTSSGGTYSNRTSGGNYYVDFTAPTGYNWVHVGNNTFYKTVSILCTSNTYATWSSAWYPGGMKLVALFRLSTYTITDPEYSFSCKALYATNTKVKTFTVATNGDRTAWAGVEDPVIYRDWNLYWYEYIVRGIYKTKRIFSFLQN